MSAVKKKKAYEQGVEAENLAAQYLRLKGYKILEQRFKTPGGEIDLIAQKKDVLVFVEVKSHKDPEAALYAVNERSRRRIETAARHYIAEHEDIAEMDMRFDVMVVPPAAHNLARNLLGALSIHHLDNAWLEGQ